MEGGGELRSLVAPARLPDNNWWVSGAGWAGVWAAVPRRVNGTRGREIGREGKGSGRGRPSLEQRLLFWAVNKGAGIIFFSPGMSACGSEIYIYTNWLSKWERTHF